MGRGTRRLPLEALQPYLLQVPAAPQPLDFAQVFGNDHDVEIEIGCGKGLFLLTASEQQPDTNFVGIEIEKKYCLFTANRIAKRDRRNVRLVCGDARVFLPRCVGDGAVARLHVYFPDPWWKTRHRKRRLFTEDFARECQRILHPGGELRLVSDVETYFRTITAIVAALPSMCQVQYEAPVSDTSGEPLTNFERKYRAEGRPIYRAVYRRCGKSGG